MGINGGGRGLSPKAKNHFILDQNHICDPKSIDIRRWDRHIVTQTIRQSCLSWVGQLGHHHQRVSEKSGVDDWGQESRWLSSFASTRQPLMMCHHHHHHQHYHDNHHHHDWGQESWWLSSSKGTRHPPMICHHHHRCFILTRYSMNVYFTKLIPSKCIKTHLLLIWACQATIMSSLSRFGQNWFAIFSWIFQFRCRAVSVPLPHLSNPLTLQTEATTYPPLKGDDYSLFASVFVLLFSTVYSHTCCPCILIFCLLCKHVQCLSLNDEERWLSYLRFSQEL